ncbi:hypothetical protein NQ317_008199 [Molorchus minor]|uniref:Uncharacterized protein n=1 Tax=Molorchus minor TaxID=1323400 RepID=A0ABQ9JAW1_9CUCU|nr:hypothetical protein NQ317_008199 [Molorchus minor]
MTFVLLKTMIPRVINNIPKLVEIGKYKSLQTFLYETADGIKAYEKGTLKEVGKEVVEVVEGGYEYTDPDGKLVSIKYIADETGFHPTGDIIPLEPNWVKNQLKFIEEHSTPQPLTAEKTT